jgi:hypothetical protein
MKTVLAAHVNLEKLIGLKQLALHANVFRSTVEVCRAVLCLISWS